MKKLIALVGLGFAFAVSSPVFASGQQDKMRAVTKKRRMADEGDERKAFMKKCLSRTIR